jgi:decaprenylphospho-beta-D-ribofuranose 2-oxidase
MSSVEAPPIAAAAARTVGTPASLSGWGRTGASRARVVRPRSSGELVELLCATATPAGVIARGAGRSYGDPAQSDGGVVLDMRGLAGVQALDPAGGEVRVGAGTSFGALLAHLAGRGLTLPVAPGTRHLTVGGAIASDVHGKNHPHAGSIARQLRSFTLCTPAQGEIEVSSVSEPELFSATLGGMGLTGAVLSATLRTIPLRRPYAVADIDRVATLEDALALLEQGPHTHAIAWLDLLSCGARFGRSIVTRSSEGGEEAGAGRLALAPRPALGVPRRLPGGLLRPATVHAFNTALWHRTPKCQRGRPLEIAAQLFPLDRVSGWNRLYGPGGLVQYQFSLPRGERDALRPLLEMLRDQRVPMYLAALKRFGPGSGGMLSFPQEGWTVAIDLPGNAAGLAAVLDRADRMVASAGGRVYLAKDSRMGRAALAAMYPELPRFRELRARVDPQEILRSDLSRRLGLTR